MRRALCRSLTAACRCGAFSQRAGPTERAVCDAGRPCIMYIVGGCAACTRSRFWLGPRCHGDSRHIRAHVPQHLSHSYHFLVTSGALGYCSTRPAISGPKLQINRTCSRNLCAGKCDRIRCPAFDTHFLPMLFWCENCSCVRLLRFNKKFIHFEYIRSFFALRC